MKGKNLSKVFWTEAMTGGLIIGVLLFVWDLVGYWMNVPAKGSSVASWVQFGLLVGGIIYFCQRMRAFRGAALGFSYANAFGFTLATMLFTGLVYGIGLFFLQVVIAPGYFGPIQEAAILESPYGDMILNNREMERMVFSMLRSPFIYIFTGIFSMLIYGGLIGLVTSIFMKRPADPFAGAENDEYNPTF